MKFSIQNFDKLLFGSYDKNILGEITSEYSSLEDAIKLIKDNEEVRVVFDITTGNFILEDITLLYDCFSANRDISFRTSSLNILGELINADLPAFLSYNYVASTLDHVNWLLQQKVSDIYITGELCFGDLELLSNLCKNNNVFLRIIPNIAQLSEPETTMWNLASNCNLLTSFWVRPEDLELYQDYIDYVEFAGKNSKQEVYYQIYAIDKSYKGKLSDLIIGLNNEIKNECLTTNFGVNRLNCRKRCVFNLCHKCFKSEYLAELCDNNNLIIDKENN